MKTCKFSSKSRQNSARPCGFLYIFVHVLLHVFLAPKRSIKGNIREKFQPGCWRSEKRWSIIWIRKAHILIHTSFFLIKFFFSFPYANSWVEISLCNQPLKLVFHLANLFAWTEKKATWLAGDKHWRHHQPITFASCLFARTNSQSGKPA